MSAKKRTVPERLTALETHMEYTVTGIDDLKDMLNKHTDHPCQACTLKDEVVINANDINWLKKIILTAGSVSSAGIFTLILDRFTGLIDKILKAFS